MCVLKIILCLVPAATEDETVWLKRSLVFLYILFHSLSNKGIELNASAVCRLNSEGFPSPPAISWFDEEEALCKADPRQLLSPVPSAWSTYSAACHEAMEKNGKKSILSNQIRASTRRRKTVVLSPVSVSLRCFNLEISFFTITHWFLPCSVSPAWLPDRGLRKCGAYPHTKRSIARMGRFQE